MGLFYFVSKSCNCSILMMNECIRNFDMPLFRINRHKAHINQISQASVTFFFFFLNEIGVMYSNKHLFSRYYSEIAVSFSFYHTQVFSSLPLLLLELYLQSKQTVDKSPVLPYLNYLRSENFAKSKNNHFSLHVNYF